MTTIGDFYCHDFTFFNGYPAESKVVRVNIVEKWNESMPEGFLKVEGWIDSAGLAFTGYIPDNVLLTVCEKEC